MEDSVTWAGTTAGQDKMTNGRMGREPGRRSWGGWRWWAVGSRVQLLGVERRTHPHFSPGFQGGLKQFVPLDGHSGVRLLRSPTLLYLWVP